MIPAYSYNLSSHYGWWDDLIFPSGDIGWSVASVGTNTNISSLGESGHPGIARYEFGTTIASSITMTRGNLSNFLGYSQMECHVLCRFPFTGTSGVYDYTIDMGFSSNSSNNASINAAIFNYNSAVSANNINTITSALTSRTTNTTSFVINTGTWYLFSIIAYPNGNQVDFYINKKIIATHTTNLPNGIANAFNIGVWTNRTAGNTNNGFFDVDMIMEDIRLNTGNSLL